MEEQATSNLSAITGKCQVGIKKLLEATTNEENGLDDLVHARDVQQMQDRFNQWAGNLGALQPSESALSLEYRLREAPLIRQSMMSSLDDLCWSIQAGRVPNISCEVG